MTCDYCECFRRVYPGQEPPEHDCDAEPVEALVTVTLTASELRMTERALEFLALIAESDDTSVETAVVIFRLRRRVLDSLQGVEA